MKKASQVRVMSAPTSNGDPLCVRDGRACQPSSTVLAVAVKMKHGRGPPRVAIT